MKSIKDVVCRLEGYGAVSEYIVLSVSQEVDGRAYITIVPNPEYGKDAEEAKDGQ